MNELTPLSASSAKDPYPYYARLVAEKPLYRDDRIGLWVATSAEAVEAVLSCRALRVRPMAEPVPKAMVGNSVGEIFARMVRMTDGAAPLALKAAMLRTFDRTDWQELSSTSATCANLLAQGVTLDDPSTLSTFAFGLPAFITASALGFSQTDATSAIAWATGFVRSMLAAADAGDIDDGIMGTTALRIAVQRLADETLEPGSFLARFITETRCVGIADEDTIANAVGFFFQGYEGTAGLIGNALLTREIQSTAFRRELCTDERLLDGYVAEVARYDSPVHNTRRFAAEDVMLMGSRISKDDAVLVVLAAANRDPSINPEPDRFDPLRENRRMYTFGFGPHACPGMRVATTIAFAGVRALLTSELDLGRLSFDGYLPRANVRVPNFGGAFTGCF